VCAILPSSSEWAIGSDLTVRKGTNQQIAFAHVRECPFDV
jgi:hypothetical protein